MMSNGVGKGNGRNWKVYDNISFFTWFGEDEDPEENIQGFYMAKHMDDLQKRCARAWCFFLDHLWNGFNSC
jgi:hypothetical protein